MGANFTNCFQCNIYKYNEGFIKRSRVKEQIEGRKAGAYIFALIVLAILVFSFFEIAPIYYKNSNQLGINIKSLHPVGFLKVEVKNTQESPTSNPFNMMVKVNSSLLSEYEAPNLGNVFWFTGNNETIPSWIESGDSSSSTSTTYWLKIPQNLPAEGKMNVYMGFANKSQKLFGKNGFEGVFPNATANYGQFDNGAQIFPAYWDFQGRDSPVGLETFTSGNSVVSVDNGIRIYAPVNYYHAGFITERTYPSNYVWMVNVSSWQIISGGPGLYPVSISDSSIFSPQNNGQGFAGGFPDSVFAYTDTAFYYQSGLNHGNIGNWNQSLPFASTFAFSWYKQKVSGYNENMSSIGDFNYSNISESSQTYFSSYIETGGLASGVFSIDWVASIYGFPQGIMPEYSVSYQFHKING